MSDATTTKSPAPTAELIEPLIRFEGPPAEFLHQLIQTQCRVINADAGAILRGSGDEIELIAAHPEINPQQAPAWLAQATKLTPAALKSGGAQSVALRVADELYGVEATQHLLIVPLRAGADVRGVGAFVVTETDEATRRAAISQLDLTAPLLAIYEMRLTLSARATSLNWLKQACGVLWEVNTHTRFRAAGMALCNQIASVWDAERVSLGIARGRYVKLHAQSHTEKFTRKTELVQALEGAMEECYDQDAEVLHPSPPEATVIARATGDLSTRFGPTSVLSLPLRKDEDVVGVLTVERAADRVFTLEEIEALRLTCNLCTARLMEMADRDRWVGARAAAATKKSAGWLVGPTHTWVKLIAIAAVVLIAVMTFGKGTYRVEAPFTIEATTQHVVAAPFDGPLLAANVKVGDRVRVGDVLVELDTSRLRYERAQLEADAATKRIEADIAKRESKTADAQMARSDVKRLQARIDLITWQIERSQIKSPIDGIVVAGDLTRQINAPVKTGDALYEIAKLDDLRARLSIPEADIADINIGQTGELAAVAQIHEHLAFDVERIEPVAEVVEQQNVFGVRARIEQTPDWLQPGMQGLAKVEIREARLGWIWTRDVMNWLRMKLWI